MGANILLDVFGILESLPGAGYCLVDRQPLGLALSILGMG